MAKQSVVDLDVLVPEEIVFKFKGAEYRLPGDIDVETTFTLQTLVVEMAQSEEEVARANIQRLQAVKEQAIKRADTAVRAAVERQRRVTMKTEAEILELFKVNHPDLAKLPFGSTGFQHVLSHVLIKLGFGLGDDEPEQDPPKKTPPPGSRNRSQQSRSSSAS